MAEPLGRVAVVGEHELGLLPRRVPEERREAGVGPLRLARRPLRQQLQPLVVVDREVRVSKRLPAEGGVVGLPRRQDR